jgi:predicted DNA-binding transcriptional regulator YafY
MQMQLRGRVTAEALAERTEVSVRTIYRDVEALCRAGVPIVTTRGRNGGFSLVQGYRTELTGLSEPEAGALPFVGLGEAAAALGLEASAEAAQWKVLAALAPRSRARANRARECFYVDPVEWYRRARVPEHLRIVAEAAWASRQLLIDYQSWTSRRKRIVEPLGLVLKAGSWYMIAGIHQRRSTAVFRLERIRAAEALPHLFERPKGFDLARAWRDEVARFEATLRHERAIIRVAPTAMPRIDGLGADAADAVRAAPRDGHGWAQASIWIEGLDHTAGLLLGFGAEIEVVEPESLRAEIARRACEVCGLYSSTTRGRGSSRKQRRALPEFLTR